MREYEGEAAGMWAQVALADLKLGEGIKSLFTDKAAAKKNLTTAVEHYEAVIPEAEDPLLIARARFGLARALESQGELKGAREVYEQIVEESGTNAYVSLAEERLKDLKRGETQDFYAWFEQQKPVSVPPAGSSLLPGTPGEKLPFDDSLLGTPGDVNFSGKNLLDIPELDKGTGPLFTPPTTTEDGKDATEPAKETPESQSAKTTPDIRKEDPGKENEEKEKADEKSEVKEDATPASGEPKSESKSSEADEGKAVADGDANNEPADEVSSGDKTP
jgi:hypothetical protein